MCQVIEVKTLGNNPVRKQKRVSAHFLDGGCMDNIIQLRAIRDLGAIYSTHKDGRYNVVYWARRTKFQVPMYKI